MTSVVALLSGAIIAGAEVQFSKVFGDDMVLQRAPAKAAVFGSNEPGLEVIVTVHDGDSSYSVDADVSNGTWKAFLKPTQAGGNWSIDVRSGDSVASLSRVIFGDVWYCGGQSNMALPLLHTMSRNKSSDAIRSGRYSNVRLHGISGNMNPDQNWTTPLAAISGSPACPDDDCQFYKYSSTCWYFAESLVDELGDSAPPIGLIHTSFGGSTIEQWLDNATIAQCGNATLDKSNQQWHDARVLPYVNMSLKGWVWYQGENDMHGTHGNSALGYGYGCLMPKLVSSWRSLWSATPGTTEPEAPFGLVTLASSGSEGGRSMGAMRWAQTANFGVLPNPAMPNTFLAQAFDLDDPFGNITCYKAGCCPNNYHPKGSCEGCLGANQYCASLNATNYYMGPIHPRDKKPVGQRLAQTGAVVAYGKGGLATGPTLSGCQVSGAGLLVSFNTSLLGADKVSVQDYKKLHLQSRVEVLVNASLFCLQTAKQGHLEECIDDGTGRDIGAGAFDEASSWVPVNISAAGPSSILVDLSHTGGVAFGVRYAWQGGCCDGRPSTSDPCPVASCPILAQGAGLPANPFMARIVDGKCKCVAPQICEEAIAEEFV